MNNTGPSQNQLRNRMLGLFGLTIGVMLVTLIISSAWNEPARAANGLAIGASATPIPTGDGSLIGKVVSVTAITTIITETSSTAVPAATPDPNATMMKLVICHSTNAFSKPYVSTNVNINSINGAMTVNGHSYHEGGVYPASPWGDVIPPYTYSSKGQTVSYPGMNWFDSSLGMHIWARGCNTDDVTISGTLQVGSYTYLCLWSANPPGYYGTTYEYQGGTWWPINTFPMTAAMCDQSITYVGTNPPTPPCVPIIGPGGVQIECTPNPALVVSKIAADTSTNCPVNKVLRSPYPRSLVNVDTNFILQWTDYDNEGGNPSTPVSPDNLSLFIGPDGLPNDAGYAAHVWKDLIVSMRSQRLYGGTNWLGQLVPNPQWAFEDRVWNSDRKYPTHQDGVVTKFNYQTSSAGLPDYNGRAYNPIYKAPADTYGLPSYSVQVKTFCGQEIKISWKEAAQDYLVKDGPCFTPPAVTPAINPDGTPNIPSGTSTYFCKKGQVSLVHWVYKWVAKDTGWVPIDLTKTGSSNTYASTLLTKAGGVLNSITYWDLGDGL
ncbi:MAG TPA: hypothetical protein VGK87_04290, partial [Anaerolineae bacterium]